ncbi:MAG: carbohydrate kinase family protein, partial [bacterium]|nr:carbohydrate kinase family protein [bacterium]
SDKSRTSTSAVLCSKNGEHTIVMYRGKNDDLLEDNPPWDELCQTKWFYLADVASQTEDLTWRIAELAEDKEIKLCFVPGQHQLKLGVQGLERVLKTTEIFILNAFEAQTLLKESKPEIPKMLKSFAQFGPKIIVITQDVNGAWGYDGKEVYFEEAPATKVVDTTGAGDAFSSAFLAAIVKNKSVVQALNLGSANAGSVISQFGAQTGLLKNIENTN